MKRKLKFVLSISTFVWTVFSGRAQTLTNLAGVWNGVAFSVPAQLMPQFSGGLVTNVVGHDAFGANTFGVNAYTNGTFTNGPVTGTMSIGGQGMLTVSPAGAPAISFRVNLAQDVFAGITLNANNDGIPQNELDVVVRSPASFDTNDILGTWQIITLDAPKQLIQSFLPTTNASAVSDLIGLDNQSVTTSPLSQPGNGYMTFNNDGTLTGNVGDSFTGNYSLATNGGFNLSINAGAETFAMNGFINVSKDTVVALHDDSVNNRQEIVLLTKPPTNAVLADLQGAWKVTSFGVPTQVLLTRDASNFVTSVTTSDGFSMDQQAFTAGDDGFVTRIMDGMPGIGSMSITTNGIVTITFTNLAGGTETHSAQLNAGKNCLTLVENVGGQLDFTIVTKSPDFSSASGQDFGLIWFGADIYWAAGTNRVLQTAGALNGSWADLPATLGQHRFSTDFTNQSGFFRVSGW